ncbi:hypothetical protein [Gordonia sp. NPDC058843]|uniref:hypothetical protein n=1 Tax=Gordonia sp. NPDC058843 TaxID=3346648 RepID=UPI0036778353
MRRTGLFGVLALAAVLTTAGCGSDADTSSDTTSPDTTAAVTTVTEARESESESDEATSLPVQPPSVETWRGSWQSVGERQPATLMVMSTDPLRAMVDIPGRCGASWTETQRQGDRLLVDATVTYGNCTDNVWSVEISDDSIVATDTEDAGTRVSFVKG